MSTDVAVYESSGDIAINRAPEEVLEEAKKAAKALGDVVRNKKKPVIMNGEQYLEFEDWQTVGRFYGVTAKITSTDYIQYGEVQGFEAKAVAIRPDGMEVSAAEAMCLNDEPNWKSKPLFQLRSMAQTRACAKALRNCLAWVVVLAGYRATPAEEIQDMAQQKTDIKPPQSKSATEPPKDECSIITAVIEEISEKSGKTGNKAWTLYGVKAGGNWYNTFDKKLADAAREAEGRQVEIKYIQGAKSKDLKEIILLDDPTCTKDPLTCGESQFDDKEKAFCGGDAQNPCKYQG